MLADCIKREAVDGKPLRILEAGCGQKWDLKLGSTPYVLTGVDLDEKALNIRVNVVKDLHEQIVGDLRSVQLSESAYDVIFSSYVLEHIPRAEAVLANFVRWVKQDGLMIIQVPDPHSVKGFVTRVTPHWFHIFYYRRIRGVKTAGMPGHGPYPTHYERVISRQGMREFCDRNGLKIEAEFGCGWRQHGKGVVGTAIQVFQRTLSLLSLGTLSSDHDDLTFIIRKPARAS